MNSVAALMAAAVSEYSRFNQLETNMENRFNPSWWSQDHDSSWEKVKTSFQRDWDQTKHDFGANKPDLNQDVPDTVKQATGNEYIPPANVANFEFEEPGLRFGYGAWKQYGSKYPKWNNDLETTLINDWPKDDSWKRYSFAVRRGYEYSTTH